MFNSSLMKSYVVVALLLVSGVQSDWSWGKNSKTAVVEDEAQSKPIESAPPVSSVLDTDGAGRSLGVPGAVLPLENHDSFIGSDTSESVVGEEDINGRFDGHTSFAESEISEAVVGEEGRNGRFLGISDKLCKIGVKGMCNKPKGYPPALPSHYGNTVSSSSYNTYSQSAYPPQNGYPVSYPKPNFAAPKPKPLKKIFDGLFNHKKSKGTKISQSYGVPSYVPPEQTYGPPQPAYKPAYKPPVPVYNPPKPTYVQPKPSYKPPHQGYKSPSYKAPAPSYAAPKPKPHYIQPKPVYPPQKPNYKQPQHYDTPKPSDIVIHNVHGQHSIPTHVVSALKPSKVQHIHTHTHIYKQNPGFDIRDSHSFSRDDGSYQASSQVKTTIDKDSSFTSDSFPVIEIDTPLAVQKKENIGFGQAFKPSQSVPFIAGFQTNQGSGFQTSQGSGFQTNQGSGFQTNQGSRFQTNQGSAFGTNQGKRHISQNSGNPNNFKSLATHQQQSFQSSIDDLANSFANNGLQSAYPVDCQCVPRQYCAVEDLVARSNSNGINQLLDARNQPSEILSNATLSDDYYDYDYLRIDDNNETLNESAVPSNETDSVGASSEQDFDYITTEEPTTSTTEESKRVRRDTLDKENQNTTSDLQGRQLTGFAPGLNGCGQDYVCCRRPVYIAAKQSAPTCGRGNPSIHGRVSTFDFEKGQSDFGEYPWQAAILRDEGPESMFVCGATLIDNRHLLTAAHCVNDLKVESLKVRLGEWDVNRDTEFYKHLEFGVSGIYIHPQFYKGNLYNDIAVVRLSTFVDINSSPHISPICLPAPNTDFTNSRCHVTGWGKDAFGDKGKFQHILKELEIPVVDHRTCEYALQNTRLGRDYKLHEGFICAGGEEGKDACKGDGGGPLVCASSDKTFELAGVVSWGIGCGQKGVPGVYVNIPHYVDWIRSTTSF